MSVFGRVREALSGPSDDEMSSRVLAAESQNELLREGLADLQMQWEDRGWERMLQRGAEEFTRASMLRSAAIARVMAVSHPLIKRGLNLRQAYVWGQGCDVQARATGEREGEQDVNAVVQAFLDDVGNKRSLTGDQAHERLERAFGTDGNIMLALFTSRLTGRVQARTIPFDEIPDYITNPGDRTDPWYYKREWTETVVNADGATSTEMRRAWYPALGYAPAPTARYMSIEGAPVMWDTPVLHLKVNDLDGWKWGIGDAYAALPDARLYRDFLSDWARLVQALSQFAFRMTRKGSKSQKAREAMTRRPGAPAPAGNPNAVGSTILLDPDSSLEAIPKTGATIDSESGRPIAAMIAAALGIPVTMLLADPGTTGNRATAETLDRPTELEAGGRRAVWTEAFQLILGHVVREAVRAPQGPLKGKVVRDPITNREDVVLDGDTEATIEVTWPPLDEVPIGVLVEALVKADATGKMPPVETVKLLLRAFGVKDVDEVLEQFLDEEGRWMDPAVTAGTAAVDAYRRGEDPASIVGSGPAEDDDDPDDPDGED